MRAKAGSEGKVTVQAGTYGGWGWDGATTDRWLAEFLASAQGINKVSKLARAHAAERHLVIVLDPVSPAGMGIPLALTARHERAAADYGLPSFTPPEPLTHLWLLPAITAGEEALRWMRDRGWTVVARRPLHDGEEGVAMNDAPRSCSSVSTTPAAARWRRPSRPTGLGRDLGPSRDCVMEDPATGQYR